MLIYGSLILAFVVVYLLLPQRFKDAPWTWFALFGSFAVLSLTILGPKYSDRQGQMETRFDNRNTASQWNGEQITSPEAIEAARLQRDADQRQLKIPLGPLLIGCGTLVLIGIVGLWLKQPRSSEQIE